MKTHLYIQDLENCLKSTVNLEKLRKKTILITGATGLIGSFLVEALLHGNDIFNLGCKVIAMGRSAAKAKVRFAKSWESDAFSFIEHDINFPIEKHLGDIDYVIHSASTTHPLAYATEPIKTISTNIIGTYNLLNFICSTCAKARLILTSSVEIYGKNRGDAEYFNEEYCGEINCNTLRAGYPESKRLSEALCQAYMQEKKLDYVSARLPRTYGPTMLNDDTKALSQFIKKGIAMEDIVLKSEGNQYFSYLYVADAVSGLLSVTLNGERGMAYNIADKSSDISLKNLANLIAQKCGTHVRFELPSETEKAGYSTATRAVMDASKLKALGWSAQYDITEGVSRTIEQLS